MQNLPEISAERLARAEEILRHRVVTYNIYNHGREDCTYLTPTPLMPTANADFDREKAAQWVASHENAKMREYAQCMIDNLQHVSFSTFYSELMTCVQGVNTLYREQQINNDEILIIAPFMECDKSNPWVTSLALPHLDITPKYILPSTTPHILKNYLLLNPGIKRILTFDDASYSGVDLSATLVNIRANARSINPNIELDIVVPYVTQHAKQLLSKISNVVSQQIMRSFADIFEINLFNAHPLEKHLCSKNQRRLDGLTLTYFDHKLADNYSVPEKCLRDGMQIDSNSEDGSIPFIPKITPPYKDRDYSHFWQPNTKLKSKHSPAQIMTEVECKRLILARYKLHCAVRQGDHEVVRELLNTQHSPCAFDNDNRSALSHAIELGDKACFELMLAHCENINFTNPLGETMVHECAERGNTELLQILIDKNAKLNLKFSGLITPLSHIVQLISFNSKCAAKLFPCFKLLTQHQAHIDEDDIYEDYGDVKHNAINSIARNLSVYTSKRSDYLLAMLIQIAKPFDLFAIARGYDDLSTLFSSVIFGKIDKLQQDLQTKNNVNETDKVGATPLMYAVLLGRKEMVRLLLENGAETKNEFYDATKLAKLSNQPEIVEMLNQASLTRTY